MDTGGTRDIIVDGDTGLLARTPADLAAAIRRIVAEPEVAERLGAQAATHAGERFEATRVVARIAALYGDLASDAGRRRDGARSISPGAGPEASASHG